VQRSHARADAAFTGCEDSAERKTEGFAAQRRLRHRRPRRVGDAYQQEFFEDEAEDNARVLRLNAPVNIAAGTFARCLKTKEWSPLEHGSIEHKY